MVMDEHNSRESENNAKDRCEGAGTAVLSQENGKRWHCVRHHLNVNRKWKEENYLLGFYFYSWIVSPEK